MRAIINLQILVSEPQFPHLVFSSVEQAAAWHVSMQGKLGRKLDAARFELVARELALAAPRAVPLSAAFGPQRAGAGPGEGLMITEPVPGRQSLRRRGGLAREK